MTDKITFTSKGEQHEMPIYGSRSGGQPVVKAQHCLNCEATEQKLHDFKQKVSDAVEAFVYANSDDAPTWEKLMGLIIPTPKPDPLVEVLKDFGGFMPDADDLRAALEARGLEIREKNDGQCSKDSRRADAGADGRINTTCG